MINTPAWRKPKKRAILNDVLSRKPNGTLYHYTTQAGLLGIIESRQIWATHTQYLNDRREFLHAVDLVREEILELFGDPLGNTNLSPALQTTLIRMLEAVKRSPENINVCVCSFSEDRDSLSQWRAYGGPAGFAIGFPSQVLSAAVERQKWFLVPCIYDPQIQRTLVRALVEEVVEENLGGSLIEDEEEDSILKRLGGNLVAYLNRYAPILKDESFKEEREWRIISRPVFCERLNYREGRSLIVPYYKLPLCEEKQNLQLDRVVVGPTPDAERSQRSVTSLMVIQKVFMQGIGGVNVQVSQVPYRDW
jgi:Protein of unknown function (DUF2971)